MRKRLRMRRAQRIEPGKCAKEYGLAVALVLLATLCRHLLDPWVGDLVPYVVFYLFTTTAIRFTSLGPSLLTIGLSTLAADWFFLPPRYTLSSHVEHYLTNAVFIVSNCLILAVAQAMRKAQAKAEQQAERLNRAQEIAHLGSWELDVVNDRLTWSDEVYRIFGREPQEFAATYEAFLEAVHPEDRAVVDAAYSNSLALGSNGYEIEHRVIRRPRGEVRVVHEKCEHIRDAEGRIICSRGMVHDITEWKQAQEALMQAREELRQHAQNLETVVEERTAKLNELIGELEHFSYTLSHDMRAPLRGMQGFAQFILESCTGCPQATTKDYLWRIIRGAERMDALVRDALDYTRAVRKELPLSPVDVGTLLCGMIKSYPNLQPSHADISLDGDFPPVMGNRAALTQCLSNLMGNAVKFVAPETKPRIHLWTELRPEGMVRLWCEDNGIGIALEHQAKVFGMFHRVSNKYEGTGIGLALVRKNVERMGGRIGVESELGKGSRFWMELKRAENAALPVG